MIYQQHWVDMGEWGVSTEADRVVVWFTEESTEYGTPEGDITTVTTTQYNLPLATAVVETYTETD